MDDKPQIKTIFCSHESEENALRRAVSFIESERSQGRMAIVGDKSQSGLFYFVEVWHE